MQGSDEIHESVARDTWLRVNTLGATPAVARAELVARYPNAYLSGVSYCPEALCVDGVDRAVLLNDPLVTDGKLYPQSLASQLPVVVLDPQPHERILDMCAAPGGKTTQIAARMQNTGEILANDSSRTRLFKLKAIAERLGVTNITTNAARGEFLWRRFADSFDRVLVDAPCSMDQSLPHKQIKALAAQQKFLLRSALACVRPGGVVVYSTCTSTERENEGVVHAIAEKVPEARIESIRFPGLPEETVTEEGFLRFQQALQGESFFVAFLRRAEADDS
jgi:16S rRNA C967 or C1407 C5-methylase (RsmB/RsmF family)